MKPFPIISICGWSGSGKTTLIESLIPPIKELGVHVAILKHVSHHFDIDHEGKDSDRFFRAGADVHLHDADESFFRSHKMRGHSLETQLLDLIRHYDLIIVEGHKQTPLPKFWLGNDGASVPDDVVGPVIQALPPQASRKEIVLNFIQQWLPKQWAGNPVYGGVLIGGSSRRMGAAKHLIEESGQTWLEKTMEILRQKTSRQAIIGAGRIPDALCGEIQLPDVLKAQGPLAGMLSAMRWAPMASWIFCACDMPCLQPSALDWLLSQREPGRWVVAPKMHHSPFTESMPALYDFRILPIIEQKALEQSFKATDLSKHPKAKIAIIPKELESSWNNFNTPDELQSFRERH